MPKKSHGPDPGRWQIDNIKGRRPRIKGRENAHGNYPDKRGCAVAAVGAGLGLAGAIAALRGWA